MPDYPDIDPCPAPPTQDGGAPIDPDARLATTPNDGGDDGDDDD